MKDSFLSAEDAGDKITTETDSLNSAEHPPGGAGDKTGEESAASDKEEKQSDSGKSSKAVITKAEKDSASVTQTSGKGDEKEDKAVVKDRREEREEAEGSSSQPISSISVSPKTAEDESHRDAPKPSRLDLAHPDIPSHLHTLPVDGGSLTQRLERALGSVAPLLREVFVDFAPFLSKTLIGSHGQELLIGGEELIS